MDAKTSSPVLNAQPFSVMFDKPSALTVYGLSFFRGPATIGRSVAELVIPALDGQRQTWTRPHVLVELRETFPPAFTDCDPTGTVSEVSKRFLDCDTVESSHSRRTVPEQHFPFSLNRASWKSRGYAHRGSTHRIAYGRRLNFQPV